VLLSFGANTPVGPRKAIKIITKVAAPRQNEELPESLRSSQGQVSKKR